VYDGIRHNKTEGDLLTLNGSSYQYRPFASLYRSVAGEEIIKKNGNKTYKQISKETNER
jgi:hypothetical protein